MISFEVFSQWVGMICMGFAAVAFTVAICYRIGAAVGGWLIKIFNLQHPEQLFWSFLSYCNGYTVPTNDEIYFVDDNGNRYSEDRVVYYSIPSEGGYFRLIDNPQQMVKPGNCSEEQYLKILKTRYENKTS